MNELIGFLAATLTIISFIPQVILIWKTKSAKGVSLSMYSIFTLGIALWFLYGIILQSWPIIISNAITLILSIFILFMKLILKD